VFEPNDERLWGNVRGPVEDFLSDEWRCGRLAGSKPEEASFVRCDRRSSSSSASASGRLIAVRRHSRVRG